MALLLGFMWHLNPHSPRISTITDVSWPNCSLSLKSAEAGIVGVNGGLDFTPNPCLNRQTSLYRQLSLYVNTGYPGYARAVKYINSPRQCSSQDAQCLAYNYGYNAGLYDISLTFLKGIIPVHWWLDVETENSWTTNVKVNRSALQGMIDAINLFAGRGQVGFYSYPGQWNLLTGKWHNNFPAWVATGSTKFPDAKQACQQSFTNGPALLGQYTPNLDQNYLCLSK